MRVPEQRRRTAHLLHELGRRQTQRRERAFGQIERYFRHCSPLLQVQDTAAGAERKLSGRSTLERGAAAPRELLPIVSRSLGRNWRGVCRPSAVETDTLGNMSAVLE